jgi:hypothetical protein
LLEGSKNRVGPVTFTDAVGVTVREFDHGEYADAIEDRS